MSLHAAAQHLASRGRDGDTELVHMTKDEVKSLQGLALAAGGSLSINPNTGLVEASFLKRILPMIAGAGLAMIPGIGPFAAAGMVGGFETLRTGDLGKGLMAGLGAYGGAGLAGSLSSAGAQTAAEAAKQSAVNAGNAVGTEAATAINPNVYTADLASFSPAQRDVIMAQRSAIMDSGIANAGQPTLANMGAGAKQVMSSPEAFGQFAKGNVMNLGAAAAPTIAEAAFPTQQMPGAGTQEEDPRYKGSPYSYRLSPNFSGYVPQRPSPFYRPTGLGYAAGGDVMLAAGGSYDDEPRGDNQGIGYAAGGGLKMGEGIARDTDEDTASLGAYDAAKKRLEKQFGAASLKAAPMPKTNVAKLGQIKPMAAGGLGGYSDGGRMLKGPGDGMSDDIPAVIGSKQPARLADGEFVVPADVVSHLGNGSTDAGARKLYKMMDKVRMARTGKKKQAPAVKTDKYLPK